MVASVSAMSAMVSGSNASYGMPSSDGQSAIARVKAEISSAKSELQCTECEDDQEDIEKKIKDLETKLRRLQSSQSSNTASADNAGAGDENISNSRQIENIQRSKAEPGQPGYWLDIVA